MFKPSSKVHSSRENKEACSSKDCPCWQHQRCNGLVMNKRKLVEWQVSPAAVQHEESQQEEATADGVRMANCSRLRIV